MHTPLPTTAKAAKVRRHPRGGAVRVVDRTLLAEVVNAIVPKGWSKERAARSLRVDRTHYGRLRSGKAGRSITLPVYLRLLQLAEGARKEKALERAVLQPGKRDLLRIYWRWLAEQLRPVGLEWWVRLEDQFNLRRTLVGRPSRRQDQGIPAKIRARQKAIIELEVEVRRHPETKREIERFETWAERRGWGKTNARYQLALMSALVPLVAGDETSGLERDAGELLKAGQLATYLRAAFTRERILLDRDADLQRLQVMTP